MYKTFSGWTIRSCDFFVHDDLQST